MSPKLKGDERDRIADDGRGGDRAARRSRAADIAMRELRHFGTVFLYLALVFGVFALHQFVVLANNGMAYTFCGASLINAAILAKIMHVAEASTSASMGWFSQRSKATRACLGTIAKLCNFAKDELVYLAGDPPNGVFGLVTGSLHVSFPRGDGEDYTLHRAGSGFWIGDSGTFLQRGPPRLGSRRGAVADGASSRA